MDKQQPPAYGEGAYPNQPSPNQLIPNQPYPQQPYPAQPVTTVIVQQAVIKPQSYMILSCLVFWFCNCIFGGIAFIFSMLSSSAADNNDMEQARKMGRVSLWINVAGIIVGVILFIVVSVVYTVYVNKIIDTVLTTSDTDCTYIYGVRSCF